MYEKVPTKDGELKHPSIKVFACLTGVMVVCGVAFVVLFVACLVTMATVPGNLTRHRVSVDGMDGVRRAVNPGLDAIAKQERREKACILVLARNEDLRALIDTLRQFEDRFNKRFQYPYVFLNDKPFTPDFEYSIRQILPSGRGKRFARIPSADWDMPAHIDPARTTESRHRLKHIVHGGSLSYRKMCRWFSGRFMHHQAVKEYEWFWRIEPGVSFPCDIEHDPFVELKKAGKVIGFSILMGEIMETIPSLFGQVLEFKRQKNIKPSKLFDYFVYEHAANKTLAYNGCHIWNNFEIGRFDFFRSTEYQEFFDHLDKAGGFFYERWGDAPVISLAAGLFLRPDQLMQFENIGYKHDDSSFCPSDPVLRRRLLCTCDPYDHGDTTMSQCMSLWRRLASTAYDA